MHIEDGLIKKNISIEKQVKTCVEYVSTRILKKQLYKFQISESKVWNFYWFISYNNLKNILM